MNAGAEQVPGDQGASQAPVADQADAAADEADAAPPAKLPWGAKPQRVRRGHPGASSRELRAQGLQAADPADNGRPLDFAPKGRVSKNNFLKSENTDIKPPVPPMMGATPSVSATSATATTAPATTSPATSSPATTAPAATALATTAPASTAPATSAATTTLVQPLAATDTAVAAATTPPVTGGDDGSAVFSYADAYETATADGMYAALDIKKPVLGSGDFHTLAEVAVQSGDAQHSQAIEVGWTVDRGVNLGSEDPHLFIFHWINGKPACYNMLCGNFIPYKGGFAPGVTVPDGQLKKFGIQHSDTGWWIAYDTSWVGHFPDSEWTDQGANFTQGGFFQAWGEVAASSSCPTGTQMGNGVAPAADSSSTAARIANFGYVNGPATPNLKPRVIGSSGYDLTFFKDASGNVSTKSFRYGGTPTWTPDPDPDKAKQGVGVCSVTPAKS
jgi:hypothetical protein